MCLDKRCHNLRDHIYPCHCCAECFCDYKCYDCYDAHANYTTPDHDRRFVFSSADVRNKFICFGCKRVWKSYTNKYATAKLAYKDDNVTNTDILKYYGVFKDYKNIKEDEEIKGDEENKGDKEDEEDRPKNAKERAEQYELSYFSPEKAKCAKCGQNGLQVGRNFRPCKTNKEWNELEKKVKNKKIDLIKDFHEYPREKKSTVNLFDKYWMSVYEENKYNMGRVRGSLKKKRWNN